MSTTGDRLFGLPILQVSLRFSMEGQINDI